MRKTIALVAPGEMGAALGACLVKSGNTVLTSLAGRSTTSRQRALAAGIQDSDEAKLAQCDFILSIVPPAAALATADFFSESVLAQEMRTNSTPNKCATKRAVPIYLDFNAISPDTARLIEARLSSAKIRFVDACIIGTTPRADYGGPFLYAAGPERRALRIFQGTNLVLTEMDAPNGAASALKMCFAAVMKGLTAMGAASFLAAARVGADEALRAELARSQPDLMAWFDRQLPAMYPKTGRWVGEMQQIAEFLEPSEGAPLFTAAAEFFSGLGAIAQQASAETDKADAAFAALSTATSPVPKRYAALSRLFPPMCGCPL